MGVTFGRRRQEKVPRNQWILLVEFQWKSRQKSQMLQLLPSSRKTIRLETFCACRYTWFTNIDRQLLKNDRVIFAGYKMPQPLEHEFVLRIQTTPDTTPLEALRAAMNKLITETGNIKLKFEVLIPISSFNLLE
jgi:DNA-directed RNA polymerase subunit L